MKKRTSVWTRRDGTYATASTPRALSVNCEIDYGTDRPAQVRLTSLTYGNANYGLPPHVFWAYGRRDTRRVGVEIARKLHALASELSKGGAE